MTHARKPFTPNKRRILEAMNDGERHWADELYSRLGMPRRNSAMYTLNWLFRYGYISRVRDDDDYAYVVIGEDRTDEVFVITGKGRQAAANLDAGFDQLNP
ncbi:hypothetical protein [Nocardia sp. BMG51109]|uniref:hypothetical protein n=1 Tax=Nocardia sp. BMG51109 TaxID=1056816 RepID=UPI0004BB140B|nr:hypothetical protein [Nocardia sp. BMG51109]